ncbi:Flagellar hook-length control protein FliK, partial [uncultured Gammaproteobacteria bacterium]
MSALEQTGAGNRARVDGGGGVDTLKLDGAGLTLDLTKISNTRIQDIEIIDIRGSGNNTLELNLNDLLDASTSTNILKVLGNSGDTVNTSGFVKTKIETENGITYDVYTHSDANTGAKAALWVQQGVSMKDMQRGFVINGETAGDGGYSVRGYSVSSAGDVNGDGLDDLIVGVWDADLSGKSYAGKSYVVFGKANGNAINLSAIADASNPTGGFVINGEAARDNSGYSVSSAGDVNGDGLDDLIVGAYQADPNGDDSGKSYVVFGKTNSSAINLSAIADASNPTGGFVINGEAAGDQSGCSVSNAGDVNGDGLDDLIVGAYNASLSGKSYAGKSYVVFGKTNSSAINLSAIADASNPTGGFVINGETAGDWNGNSVSSAGDVN